jgi:hypothetical protein
VSCAAVTPVREARADVDAAPAYDVSVAIDLDVGRYSGRETVRVTNRGKGAIQEVRFVLPPNLSVASVWAGGAPIAVRQEDAGLTVRLAERLLPAAAIDLTLAFEGRAVSFAPEQTGLGAHVTDQVTIVLAPGERREAGPSLTHSGDAMLLGSPFPVLAGAGTGDWRIAVTAPEGVDVVASGTSAARATPDGPRVFEGAGLRHVALFASRGFVRVEAEASGVRLRSVASEAHGPAARRTLETLAGAVTAYSELFGDLPLHEITIVEAPLAPGTSSLAFAGIVAIASAYYVDLRSPEAAGVPGFIRDTPELTEGELDFAVLRETSRQWWGEAVGVDAEREAFLDEGLAAYSGVLAVERSRSAEAATTAVEQRLRAPYRVYRMFGGQDAPAKRRASEFPNYFAFAAIVVSKGGLFLGALRAELGDERFFEGLRRLYAARRGDMKGFTAAFVPPRDRTAGAIVDRLYDRWIEQRHGDEDVGAPEYAIAVGPDVAERSAAEDPKRRSAFERFGKLIVRKMVWFGKTAAKPF